MKLQKTLGMVLLLALLGTAQATIAHEAPVDKDGCHLDDKGRKHCH